MRNIIRPIIITGPTGSGKSSIAMKLAEQIDGEIICADSMQIYTDMNILTAKPTLSDMNQIKHHLFSFVNPNLDFNVSQYKTLVLPIIENVISEGKYPIITGGTGQYITSLLKGINYQVTENDYDIRCSLEKEADFSLGALYDKLCAIDPKSAEKIHSNDKKRIIRALEIYYKTGITKSEAEKKSIENGPEYDYMPYCISHDRDILYQRINNRVDLMISDGLADEVRNILINFPDISKTAMQAIGLKEFIPYFKSEKSFDDIIEKIKQSTRNYAKRQLTWFKRLTELSWIINCTTNNAVDKITQDIETTRKSL